MLKKLFVHEWKDCWRLVGLMNLIVIGLTLIGTVVMQSDTWSFASENAIIRLTMTLYVMAYIASIAALSLVTVFFFYNRFYIFTKFVSGFHKTTFHSYCLIMVCRIKTFFYMLPVIFVMSMILMISQK